MNNIKPMYLLFVRHVIKNFYRMMWLVMGLLQPMLYIILYMPLLQKTSGGFSNSDADVVRIFVPGMMVTMSMSGFFAGFAFIDEMRQGVIARWLVSPVSRSGIMLSVISNHLIFGIMQSIMLLLIACFFGLNAPLFGIILSILLTLLLGVTTVSISHIISIKVKDEGILAAITQSFYLPLMLLSGVMLPISLAPNWMQNIALCNPFYYVVEATRALFAGDYANIFIIKGFAITLASALLFMWLAIRGLKKMSD